MKAKIALLAIFAAVLMLAGVCIGAEMTNASMNASAKNLIDTARAQANLSDFVDAVMKAGLVERLSEPGPYTVFAPDNQAFEKFKRDFKEDWNDATKLQKALLFHVVSGKLMSKDLKNGSMLKTLEGQNLTIGVTPQGNITVNGAKVLKSDIIASNGVQYIIDTVANPLA